MTHEEAKDLLIKMQKIEVFVIANTGGYPYTAEETAMMHAFDLMQNLILLQLPYRPIGKHTEYYCPRCHKRVRSGKGSSSRVKDTVCRNCYQVLDWEGTE